MYRFLCLVVLFGPSWSYAASPLPKPVVSGLKNPQSITIASDGRTFLSVAGEFNKDGDGGVYLLKGDKAEPFAEGMNDPKGVVAFQQSLFVTDKTLIRRLDLKTGKSDVVVEEAAFPVKPQSLQDITVDEFGTFYVSDIGDGKGEESRIYRISVRPKGKSKQIERTITVVTDSKKASFLKNPTGLLMDSLFHLFILDASTGEVNRLRISDSAVEKVAEGFTGGDGICFDHYGRIYISSRSQGKIWSIPRPSEKPVLMTEGLSSAADLYYDPPSKSILVADTNAGSIFGLPAQPPGFEVDETPLPLTTEVAFDKLTWTGWDSGEESGKNIPLRPIVLTHAGDGSNRVFVATQHGVIHVFPDDPNAQQTKIFLDIQAKVTYNDNENEQGLLGLAFHPKFKENGEFFLFYTDKKTKLQNVLSRFRVSKDDPNKADPNSEEELLRISHRFWNHDGGTVCFGPDGYLYLVLGDGGAANDPDDHGQKKNTLLGKILRIDINSKSDGKPYSIPKDNPFVGQKEFRPEIFALGVRNPWRLAFDRKTGQGWFGEVGQNIWEEINLLEKGGNYGWRRRESLHPFWVEGTGPKKEFIDPIWEYHHDVGRSITGGHVYRGKQFPELDGCYLYADYVFGRLWALKYDETKKRVVANHPIKDYGLQIMSFGEDEKGEVYLLTYSAKGKGIYRYARTSETPAKKY